MLPCNQENSQEKEPFSKTVQYLTLLTYASIQFGDAVEVFIPSVITQQVSCELALTQNQEYVLALSLYLCLGLSIVLAIPLSNRFGRRYVILVAIYLSIITTVLCSLVANYVTLLLSRVFLGFSIALNASTSSVYMSEIAGSKSFRSMAITLGITLYTVGGGWCGLLGYFLLDRLPWRHFILVCSIPIFIVPILLLQFYLPESHPAMLKTNNNKVLSLEVEEKPLGKDDPSRAVVFNKSDTDEKTPLLDQITPKPNTRKYPSTYSIFCRITKLLLAGIGRGVPYFGAMLLVPVLIKDNNIINEDVSPCAAMHGEQFLWITLLFGICHIVGRAASYGLQDRVSTATQLTITSAVSFCSIIVINIYPHNFKLAMISIAVIQTFFACSVTQTAVMANDRTFFPVRYLALASGIACSSNYFSMAVGNTIAEVMDTVVVLKIYTGFCAIALAAGISFFFKD